MSSGCWWKLPQHGGAGGLREQKKLIPSKFPDFSFLKLQLSCNFSTPH